LSAETTEGEMKRNTPLRIPKPGSKITMFGYPEPMKWKFDATTGLKIDIPESLEAEDRRPNQYAWGWTIRTA
jgi:hypothetical protein